MKLRGIYYIGKAIAQQLEKLTNSLISGSLPSSALDLHVQREATLAISNSKKTREQNSRKVRFSEEDPLVPINWNEKDRYPISVEQELSRANERGKSTQDR